MKRLTRIALVCAAILVVKDAPAVDDAACCLNSTSRLDAIMNPVKGGDEEVFTRTQGPSTIMFLVGNSQTMQDYVASIPGTAVGCPAGDPLETHFNIANLTPPVADPDVEFDPAGKMFFNNDKLYVSYGTRMPVRSVAGFPDLAPDAVGVYQDYRSVDSWLMDTDANRQLACQGLSNQLIKRSKKPLTAAQKTACSACLLARGWYRAPANNGGTTAAPTQAATPSSAITELNDTNWGLNRSTALYVLRGNLVNQRPPKYVTARQVMKSVINGITGVRIGVATMGPGRGLYDPATVFAAETEAASATYNNPAVGPSCFDSFPFNNAKLTITKQRLINQINNKPGSLVARVTGSEYQDWPAQTGIYFNNRERSVGESLFSLAGFFSSQRESQGVAGRWGQWFHIPNMTMVSGYPGHSSTYGSDGTAAPHNPSMWLKGGSPFASSATNDSFCWSCGKAAVVVLVDGMPQADNSIPVTKMLSLAGAPLNPGINYCDQVYACGAGTVNIPCTNGSGSVSHAAPGAGLCTKTTCDAVCDARRGPLAGNYNFADDTAYFMSRVDLRDDIPNAPNPQVVNTYTIGFGDNAPMLQSIARAGGGKFFMANNATELQTALESAISDVVGVNNAFTAPSVASLQTGNTDLTAVLPRMLPRSGANWRGELWRFDQFNEFVSNQDKNGDGDKEDIVLVDSQNDVIIEDTLGRFLKAATLQPAVPFWEARAKLIANGYASRNIYTVTDSDGDGVLTSADTMISFSRSTTNVASAEETKLAGYLGIKGTSACPTGSAAGLEGKLLQKLALSVPTAATLLNVTLPGVPTQADYDKLCVRVVIDFVRGRDLADEDGDGDRNETAESVLADIFHSSPTIVVPPVDKFLCDFGLHNQCARTLYTQELPVTATSIVSSSFSRPACGVNGARTLDAYDHFAYLHRKREKLILVGTNGGMLHGFRDEVGTESCATNPARVTYAPGASSGNEAWAFIPPDLLPRLFEQMLGHVYLVDGDVMVRDVWADGSGASATQDGIKQYDEYKTVAIVGEGRGGKHYFALEMRFDASGNAIAPGFRWMYPQPCSVEATKFGKTLLSISPKAAPVGPVLMDATTLSGYTGATVNRYGVNTVERWMAVLSGGWSPALDQGRGVYFVDAWNGKVNGRSDNLWWKFEYDPAAAGVQNSPRRYLTHSVAAPVSLADYGTNQRSLFDGFFDTGVFGDTLGQLWVLRFQKPGRLNAGTKLVDNWAGARAFSQGEQTPNSNQWPFFYTPTLALQPENDALRVFIGSGNRYSVVDNDAGECRYDNPVSCTKRGCSTLTNTSFSNKVANVTANTQNWSGYKFNSNTLTTAAPAIASFCGAAGGAASVVAEHLDYEVNSCPTTTLPASYGDLHRTRVECRQSAAGDFSCQRTDAAPQLEQDLGFISPAVPGQAKNRFYGLWVYGGDRASANFTTFDEDKTTSALPGRTAEAYDAERLTDRRTGAAVFRRHIPDVTAVSCTTSGCTPAASLATANDGTWKQFGWAYEYDAMNQKTATSATLLSGCVIWNTIYPTSGLGTGPCSGSGALGARLYQADYITGAPNCASGFLGAGSCGGSGGAADTDSSRCVAREVRAPPPEPTIVIQRSPDGQMLYSTMLVEPGMATATKSDVSLSSDVLRSVFELPVSRSTHDCRHVNGANCTPSAP